MVYTKEEIYDEICKFVTSKPGRTINQVVEHIYNPKNKNMCAKQTAEDRVRELIGNRLIDNQSREGGFHSLHINDKDEFNDLVDRIEKMSNRIKKVTELVKSHKDLLMSSTKLVSYLHIIELIFNNFIVQLAFKINWKIKSTSNHAALNARLIDLLYVLGELSMVVTPPEIVKSIMADLDVSISKEQSPKINKLMRSIFMSALS